MSGTNTCENCKFFGAANSVCRRGSPGMRGWPKVDAGDWCGNHRQIQIDPPPKPNLLDPVLVLTGSDADFVPRILIEAALPGATHWQIARAAHALGATKTRRRYNGGLHRGFAGVQLREPA